MRAEALPARGQGPGAAQFLRGPRALKEDRSGAPRRDWTLGGGTWCGPVPVFRPTELDCAAARALGALRRQPSSDYSTGGFSL